MLQESNKELTEAIKENKPFIASRIWMGPETNATILYLDKRFKFCNFPNAGIYSKKKEDIKLFYENNLECLKNSKFLCCFDNSFSPIEKKLLEHFNLTKLKSRILEPFYACLEELEPWSLHLFGKKVLIINPFVDSFQKQLKNNFRFFKDKIIFHPEQEFVFYKTYQTSAGNHIHSSWVETFELMKEGIRKLDFDIALLGCGGYGLSLCNFIKMELGKSAIYVGGGLQLLFGVKGRRWETHPIIKKLIDENGTFISPSGDEVMKNKDKIENGCYW